MPSSKNQIILVPGSHCGEVQDTDFWSDGRCDRHGIISAQFLPLAGSQLAARPSAKTDSEAACELNNLALIAPG
jgi:hypothetical protein